MRVQPGWVPRHELLLGCGTNTSSARKLAFASAAVLTQVVPGKKFGCVISARACKTLTRTACAPVSRACACARVSLPVSRRACVICASGGGNVRVQGCAGPRRLRWQMTYPRGCSACRAGWPSGHPAKLVGKLLHELSALRSQPSPWRRPIRCRSRSSTPIRRRPFLERSSSTLRRSRAARFSLRCTTGGIILELSCQNNVDNLASAPAKAFQHANRAMDRRRRVPPSAPPGVRHDRRRIPDWWGHRSCIAAYGRSGCRVPDLHRTRLVGDSAHHVGGY